MVTKYSNRKQWATMAIRNIAFSGKFGSDGTIKKYADDIWNIKRSPVKHLHNV
jgi:starch phosphorylase